MDAEREIEVAGRAPQPSLRARRHAQTRSEVIDAVLRVIAGVGLSDVTIDRVTAESAISRGTVYAHFPGGRDELIRAAYGRLGADLVDRAREAAAAAHNWRDRVLVHADTMFELAADSRVGHFYNVSGPAVVRGSEERGIGSGASAEMIGETLREAQRAGEVSGDIDAGAMALLLVGAIREASISVALAGGDRERARAAFSALVAGLAAR